MKVIFYQLLKNGEKPILQVELDRVPNKGEKVYIDGVEWRVNSVYTKIRATGTDKGASYWVHVYNNFDI